MRQIAVVIDVVGSTVAKAEHGESEANRMIAESLRLAEVKLCAADPNLRHSGQSSAGDDLLLVGGTRAVELYRAAKIRQGVFRALPQRKLPVKIAMGYANFEESIDERGIKSLRGSDLDFLYRICDECRPATIVVTNSFYAQLEDVGLGNTLHRHEKELCGIGPSVFWSGNGDYVMVVEAPINGSNNGCGLCSVAISAAVSGL